MSVSSGSISRRKFVLATSAIVAAPALIGRAKAATPIKLAHIQSLTGPSGSYGIRGRDGASLAVKDINAAGGVKIGSAEAVPLEIAIEDMANDPKQAITAFRQFAADPAVVVCLGPINSIGFIPLISVASEIGLPLIGNGSLAPVKAWNPWAFRANTISAVATPALLKAVVAKEKFKRLAVIYDQTQDNQVGDANLCKALAPQLGYEVVAFEAFRANDQDFSPQIATIRAARPDAIYIGAATADGIKIVLQMRELGFKQRLLTGSGSFQDGVFWDGTHGEIEGDYTWLAQDLAQPSPALKDFMTRYDAAFPQAATLFSINGYDSVMVAVEAMKKAGSTGRAAVKDVLGKLKFTTSLGTPIGFDNPPTGDNINATAVIVQIKGRGSYTRIS